MENEIDDLKSIWRSAKKNAGQFTVSTADLIKYAEAKKKKAIISHYGNILVLSMVVVMLAVSFYYFFPFQDTLSRTGIGLMIGGLIVRITVEFFSVRKSSVINTSDTTTQATENTLQFLQFRKKVHGPVTYTLVFLYIVGFYMLTPEFSRYLSTLAMVLIDSSFVVGAAIVTWFVRSGIRQELEDLQAVADIKNQLLTPQ